MPRSQTCTISLLRRIRWGWPGLAAAFTWTACSHPWDAYGPTAEPVPLEGASGGGGTAMNVNEGGGAVGGDATSCADGQTECDGACVNPLRDGRHCGGCGRACAGGESCDEGICHCFEGPLEVLASRVPQVLPGTTIGAQDLHELSCAVGRANDQSFRFTAPSSGLYMFEVLEPGFEAALALIDADSCGEIACSIEPSGWEARAEVELTEGKSVHVVVSGVSGAQGDFSLDVRARAPCTPTDLGSTVPQTASGNTSDSGDALLPTCGSRGTPDALYRFTAPFQGSYRFDTLGSSYDTVLAVVEGDCSGAVIGCDDDTLSPMSLVAAQLGAGQSVVVAVDGASASGEFELNVLGVPIADCLAIPLGQTLPLSVTGTTVDGVAALMASCIPGATWGPEKVHGFTAPRDGTYVIDTLGSSYDTLLYVMDGGCSGTELGCNDDSSSIQSELSVTLVAGQTVAIVVDGFDGGRGDYVLNIHE
jgi:Stigma-specific protein, Stig1